MHGGRSGPGLPDPIRTSFPDQPLPRAQPLGSCAKSGQSHLSLAVFAVLCDRLSAIRIRFLAEMLGGGRLRPTGKQRRAAAASLFSAVPVREQQGNSGIVAAPRGPPQPPSHRISFINITFVILLSI